MYTKKGTLTRVKRDFNMGSILSATKERRLDSLREKVLEYLTSERKEHYRINPAETFSDIYQYNYSTLTDFIRDIKPKEPLNFQDYHPPIETGLRYVMKDNPKVRGKLVKVKTISENEKSSVLMGCIELDSQRGRRCSWLALCIKVMTFFISWIFPNFGKSFQTIPIDKLELEKEHLKRILIDSSIVTQKTSIVGPYKGIEGSNNSCYLDSLFVCMFYRTSIFDRLVTSKLEKSEYAKTTRDLLAKCIVQPLRTGFYCSSESAMKLRSHLRTLNEDIMGSFMDVEQLLYLLVEDALKEQEFIQYSGGGGDYMHLMSIDIRDNSSIITVQNNFETSMELNGNLKLKNVPNPGLILGLPRSDGKFVNYEAVIHNTELNIQHLMEPATCETCSQPASWEIFKEENAKVLQTSCDKCLAYVLRQKDDTSIVISRAKMRLLAIICISASHFTAFIRDSMGSGDWLYFDSMAGGYPEVKIVKDLDKWLNILVKHPEELKSGCEIPVLIEHTYTNCHMCIYEPILFGGNKDM